MKYQRSRIRNEWGRIGFQAIMTFIVLAGTIYVVLQMILVYNKQWTFEKDVQTLIRFAFVNLKGEKQPQIINAVSAMLNDMGAQYDPAKIMVNVDEQDKKITIDVWYTQTVRLPLFPNPKPFYLHVQSSNTLE